METYPAAVEPSAEVQVEAGLETEVVGTTPYDYDEVGWYCEKLMVRALGARLLPPLYALVFIVGVLGNVVVILVLIKYRRLRVLTNIYLLNLAASDLLFLLTLPFWIHGVLWSRWAFGGELCRLLSGLYSLGLYSEIFFIILLTVDRYLAIVHAVFALRARTVTFGVLSSVVTWALAGLVALPEFIFQQLQEESVCSPLYPDGEEESWKRFHALRMNALGLALPLLVMAVCYSGIVRTLLRCPNRKKHKAIRLIFVIMLAFFLFWTPYNLALLLSVFQATFFEMSCELNQRLDVALQVSEVIASTHCCVNPVIYAFVGERFRKSLRHFFHRRVAVHLGKYIPFLPGEKPERSNSVSPSTGEHELSVVF